MRNNQHSNHCATVRNDANAGSKNSNGREAIPFMVFALSTGNDAFTLEFS